MGKRARAELQSHERWALALTSEAPLAREEGASVREAPFAHKELRTRALSAREGSFVRTCRPAPHKPPPHAPSQAGESEKVGDRCVR